jgi:hypothetical protein
VILIRFHRTKQPLFCTSPTAAANTLSTFFDPAAPVLHFGRFHIPNAYATDPVPPSWKFTFTAPERPAPFTITPDVAKQARSSLAMYCACNTQWPDDPGFHPTAPIERSHLEYLLSHASESFSGTRSRMLALLEVHFAEGGRDGTRVLSAQSLLRSVAADADTGNAADAGDATATATAPVPTGPAPALNDYGVEDEWHSFHWLPSSLSSSASSTSTGTT